MLSRRGFVRNLIGLFGGVALAAQPWRVSFDGDLPAVQTAEALARGKGKGKGPGGKGGRGKGSKGPAAGKRAGANGKAAGKSKGKKSARSARATVDVRHPDGTLERIRKNRYIMKDAKGRTIVNRPAKGPDRVRLNKLGKHAL